MRVSDARCLSLTSPLSYRNARYACRPTSNVHHVRPGDFRVGLEVTGRIRR